MIYEVYQKSEKNENTFFSQELIILQKQDCIESNDALSFMHLFHFRDTSKHALR